MNRLLIRFLVGTFIGIGALLIYFWKSSAPTNFIQDTQSHGVALVGGDFTLTDQDGIKRNTKDFRGKILLVYFGYTYCPDICPMALENISGALKALGKEKDLVRVLFISVDPKRDNVETLKLYQQNFDPNIIMLTGTEQEVQKAMQLYRATAKVVESDDSSDYLLNHTSLVYVMGPKGHFLEAFAHSSPASDIQKILLRLVKNHQKELAR